MKAQQLFVPVAIFPIPLLAKLFIPFFIACSGIWIFWDLRGTTISSECVRISLSTSTSTGGGLKVPSLELLHYISALFGILQIVDPLVRKSNCRERIACEHILKKFGPTPEFMCCDEEHNKKASTVAIRIAINIFYNNSQKESKDSKRKDKVKGFKTRQRKKDGER